MAMDDTVGVDAHIGGVDYVLEPGMHLVTINDDGSAEVRTIRPVTMWDPDLDFTKLSFLPVQDTP